MTFAEKLTKLRRAQNYTQEQLADLLGVSRQAVSRWESSLAYPETEKLIKIGEMFDCSIDYLLKDSVEELSPTVTEVNTPAPKPKKKRGIIAVVTVVSVLVIALLTAAFVPRTTTITIRGRNYTASGYEYFEATYKEVASTMERPDAGYSDAWNMYGGDWDLKHYGYDKDEFYIIDIKNLDKGSIGGAVFADFGYHKLYLYDRGAGIWRIFIADSCTDNAPSFLKFMIDVKNGEYYKYYVD